MFRIQWHFSIIETGSYLAIRIDFIVNHALLLSNAPLDLIQVILVFTFFIRRALLCITFLIVLLEKNFSCSLIYLFLQLASLLIFEPLQVCSWLEVVLAAREHGSRLVLRLPASAFLQPTFFVFKSYLSLEAI